MAQIPLTNMADMQRRILTILKRHGESSTAQIAERAQVSYEGARQQIKQLEAAGWVRREERPNPTGVGRPLGHYSLSPAGEHLFPKNYDALALDLMDAIGDALGQEGLRQVLSALTDVQVGEWKSRLEDLDLEERLEALRGIYLEEDPFTQVASEDGELQLVERNCPYLNVASKQPAICSLTVSSLSRLVGYRVRRVDRFQEGDGRCTFRVDRSAPISSDEFRFEFEGEH